MDPFDPILDQPYTIDLEKTSGDKRYPLANQEIRFEADAQADLHHLAWPWADEEYAHRIVVNVVDLHDEEFMPLVTRAYPSYQELICGTEGMIVSKRLAALLGSYYDRSVMWLLDCQAEGDRLLRIDVEIDWGEALTQRMVDGLLVAQRNPRGARGLYGQHNADSTRVFGNPQGRPSEVDLEDPSRARLSYYVLVNGMVEVALLLAISDVGEQVAWNGFLAQRDSALIFEKSVNAWQDRLQQGRLWTPDPQLNRAIHHGRVETMRHIQRLRTGLTASDRLTAHVPALVAVSDTIDLVQSRNLLAHLRRVADKSDGALPAVLPLRVKDPVTKPDPETLWHTNGAYLRALAAHLTRHFDAKVLEQHYASAVRVVDRLILAYAGAPGGQQASHTIEMIAAALRAAQMLAQWQNDQVNLVRWQSEATTLPAVPPPSASADARSESIELPPDWKLRDNGVWSCADPWHAIEFAGRVVWDSIGLQQVKDQLHVIRRWPVDWSWWALLDLPQGDDRHLSLVWDGHTLHATAPIVTELPLAVHDQIRTLNAGEEDFALTFAFINTATDTATLPVNAGSVAYFRPEFLDA
jgi:hypothetical protein